MDASRITSKEGMPFIHYLNAMAQILELPPVDLVFFAYGGVKKFTFNGQITRENCPPILVYAREHHVKNAIFIPEWCNFIPLNQGDHYNWKRISKQTLKANQAIKWKSKRNQLIWRGGNTDHTNVECPLTQIEASPREQLVELTQKYPKKINAKFVSKGRFYMSRAQQIQCKYQMVMDGFTCTYPGYQWRLLSNSVTFKQESPNASWFYRALKPYQHYIPVKNNLSDLVEKIKWANKNQEKIKTIAEKSTRFVQNNLMPLDICAYMYLVIQKYASLQN